jgi:hypothetical protein
MAKSASPQSSPSSILDPPSSISPLSSPRTLLATIWLTPFDLGIRQRLTLTIDQGDFPEIWEVRVVLDRLSGDDASWHRMNRPFLTALRREFLQWRSRPQQRSRAGIADPSLAAS